MSFGAFLAEDWRKNDMLWGRLDGAERIISALLPEKDTTIRDQLIKEAQMSILAEESRPNGLLPRTFERISPEEIWKHYKEKFQVNRALPAKVEIDLISRATNVTGRMLEGLADKHRFDLGSRTARAIAWLGAGLKQVGQIFFKATDAIRGIFR
jgi:hypothetical protein